MEQEETAGALSLIPSSGCGGLRGCWAICGICMQEEEVVVEEEQCMQEPALRPFTLCRLRDSGACARLDVVFVFIDWFLLIL